MATLRHNEKDVCTGVGRGSDERRVSGEAPWQWGWQETRTDSRKRSEVLRKCFLKVGHQPPTFELLVELGKIQIPGFLTRYTVLEFCRNPHEGFTRLFF